MPLPHIPLSRPLRGQIGPLLLARHESENQRTEAGPGLIVWFSGLSSAGKTTLSAGVEKQLSGRGLFVEKLDGDVMRKHLCADLGFSREDRDENVRRIGRVAEMLARHGTTVLVSAIAPYRAAREEMRERCPVFVEVYVNAPLAVCEARDVKGLYRRARSGELPHFTGVDDPYEPPLRPDLECRTDQEQVDESVAKVVTFVESYRHHLATSRAGALDLWQKSFLIEGK